MVDALRVQLGPERGSAITGGNAAAMLGLDGRH